MASAMAGCYQLGLQNFGSLASRHILGAEKRISSQRWVHWHSDPDESAEYVPANADHSSSQLTEISARELRIWRDLRHSHPLQVSTSQDRLRQLCIRISIKVIRKWQCCRSGDHDQSSATLSAERSQSAG